MPLGPPLVTRPADTARTGGAGCERESDDDAAKEALCLLLEVYAAPEWEWVVCVWVTVVLQEAGTEMFTTVCGSIYTCKSLALHLMKGGEGRRVGTCTIVGKE